MDSGSRQAHICTHPAMSSSIYTTSRARTGTEATSNAKGREVEMPVDWKKIIDDDVLAHYRRTRTMQKDFAALAAHLDKLEIMVAGNDRTFREIIEGNATLAARLNKLEKWVNQYVRVEVARHEAYEDLASRLDAQQEDIIELYKCTRALQSKAGRLDMLERRLAELEAVRKDGNDAPANHLDALEAELNGLRDIITATLKRLAELERAVGEHWAFFADQIIKLEERVTALEELHGTLERQPAEWVRVQGRHGQLPNDVYNVNVTERREEA